MIIIHTAQIKPSAHDLILLASMKRCDVVQEAKAWHVRYPGKKITYKTIVEDADIE